MEDLIAKYQGMGYEAAMKHYNKHRWGFDDYQRGIHEQALSKVVVKKTVPESIPTPETIPTPVEKQEPIDLFTPVIKKRRRK